MIGVVGASARAAAMSLARAGHSCWAVDLFNDRDLQRIAPCRRCPIEQFPHAIPAFAQQFPPGPVLCTGGMEHHPEVLAELAAERELLGCDPEAVRLVRDPFNLPNRPETLAAGCVVPDSDFLMKSLRSSGGLGVRRASAGEIIPAGCVAQRFVDGPALSAVFHNDALLGITEQLVGVSWLHAEPFHYAGTIFDPANQPRFALRSSLKGWHGIDFILNAGSPSVLEINPRYPASVEVIEFAKHLRSPVGKAIWFAPHAFRFPDSGPWDADLVGNFDPWRLPHFADIPAPGEPFEPGHPVLTFFATGHTADECRERLQSQAAVLDRLFSGSQP